MSGRWGLTVMFRTLLLVSGDNASAAPIPDQTADAHVLSE